VPYRLARRRLGLASSEDYDTLMLRFCAGEAGLARVTPEASRERFRAELASPHPDLGVLRGDETATIVLDPAALARSRGPGPEAAYAPPPPLPAGPVPPLPPIELPLDEVIRHPDPVSERRAAGCACCGATLPEGRVVHFCPHCGQNQTPLRCHACEADVEAGWTYCIACGHGLGPR